MPATILLALLALHDTLVSGGELIPEQAAYDVESYELAIRLIPEREAIEGRLSMWARATGAAERIALDLDPRLAVSRVETAYDDVEWQHRDGRIWIDFGGALPPGALFEVVVEYGGEPRAAPRPPWDGGFTWGRTKKGAPWIATSCQGEGADLWWPCKDHPSDKPESVTVIATVPKGLFCASNGVLAEVREGKRETTYVWETRFPISNYNVALNVGPYVELDARYRSVAGEEVPVSLWVLPESRAKAKGLLSEILEHLAFFEELCGPYPFRTEKYGVVETPHLGMEHQTIVAYGNGFSGGPYGYDWLHHHELAHEWWGNLVTCRDWKDMWLHEGFGTYMQVLYTERLHGRDGLARHVRRLQGGLRNARPVAPRRTQDSKEIYFGPDGGHDNDIYEKGACVLHTLRWLMGDEPFFRALRRMAYPDPALEEVTDGSHVRFADTEDFRAIAEKEHGADLGWFFEVYLRQPRLPRLSAEREGRELRLAWDAPVEVTFPLPVPVRAGGELHRVEMPGGEGRLALRGTKYELDPERWLLRAE